LGENLLDDEFASRYGARKPRLEPDHLAPIDLTPLQLQNFVGNYVARNSTANIALERKTLVKQENELSSIVRFTSPTDAFIVGSDREVASYRYYPANTEEPAHLECSVGEDSLDFNHAPHDPPGPNKAEWAHYLVDTSLINGHSTVERHDRAAERLPYPQRYSPHP
jgi:hypothetical protein